MKNLKWFSYWKKGLSSLRGKKLSQNDLFTVGLGVAILLTTSTTYSAIVLIHDSPQGPQQILEYNTVTGASGGPFIASTVNRNTFLYGPDGNLYVTETGFHKVVRYDGKTGAYMDDFVQSGSGGLMEPTGMTFGPNGDLYVSSYTDGKIRKYNGLNGNFIEVFVDTMDSVVYRLEMGLVFSPYDTVLYAAASTGELFRFHANTLTRFMSDIAGDLAFGPDGKLYAATLGGGVRRFNGMNGTFIDFLVPQATMNRPRGMEFGPDENLYVLDQDYAYRFDGMNGLHLGTFAMNTGGFRHDLTFTPDGALSTVPEPGSLGLLAIGGLSLVGYHWRRKRKPAA